MRSLDISAKQTEHSDVFHWMAKGFFAWISWRNSLRRQASSGGIVPHEPSKTSKRTLRP